MLRKTLTFRRALAALLPLALLTACAPAPSVTPPQAAIPSGSAPLQVQGVVTAAVEQVVFETSPYHEVEIDSYFEPYVMVPVAERASIPADVSPRGLIPDPERNGRFTRASSPDAPGVTHLGYYPDWLENFTPLLVATRGGVVATRVGYTNIGDLMRLAFPQASEGPITITGTSATMGLIRWDEDADEDGAVYREFTFDAEQVKPLADAKDAVVEFSVSNLGGEPINGLSKEHIRFIITSPEYDDKYEADWTYPFDTLEALGQGKYRIRLPFSPEEESGTVRFKVEVVNPETPISATFYRR